MKGFLPSTDFVRHGLPDPVETIFHATIAGMKKRLLPPFAGVLDQSPLAVGCLNTLACPVPPDFVYASMLPQVTTNGVSSDWKTRKTGAIAPARWGTTCPSWMSADLSPPLLWATGTREASVGVQLSVAIAPALRERMTP